MTQAQRNDDHLKGHQEMVDMSHENTLKVTLDQDREVCLTWGVGGQEEEALETSEEEEEEAPRKKCLLCFGN